MKEMKTLTINGAQYTIADPDAAHIDDSKVGTSAWSSAKISSEIESVSNKLETKHKAVAIECEADGEVITVDDSSDDYLRNLKLFGKTTQFTTTGKNLAETKHMQSVTGQYGRLTSITPIILREGLSYTVSFDTENTGIGCYLNPESFNSYQAFTMDGKRKSFTFNMTEDRTMQVVSDGTTTLVSRSSATSDVASGLISNVQIEVGSNATTYEPYTGGMAAPNPDYPQELVSAGNSGAIKTHVSGKNLYDTTNGFVSGDYQGVCIKAGETFTASAYSASGDRALNYRIGYADNTAAYFSIIPKDAANNKWYTQTYTAPKDVVTVGFYHLTDGTANRSGLKLMVERGAVKTEYEDCKGTQTLTASTPNGLPGIPVAANGNYTDENGQQWVCDEIDFVRGVYVQRIRKYQIKNPSLSGAVNYNSSYSVQQINFSGAPLGSKYNECLSPQFAYNLNVTSGAYAGCRVAGNVFVMGISKEFLHRYGAVAGNVSSYQPAFVAWANELIENGTPLEFLYVLPEPIETALSAEELVEYAELHTNKPNTTVYNDSGASVILTYTADNKTYIDKKFAELAAAIVNNA